jgi:ABC-2 type transport system ATP-binding protein
MSKIIKVNGLTKRFNGLAAVDDITFSVEKGELFAFLGPNGAGKTTTIKMLTTLLNPTSGHIEINRIDPSQNPDQARASFGIVFQDQSLDEELTAYENMEYHGVLYRIEKDKRQKRITSLLKYVELWDRRDDMVKKFSGGMRRRLEIARGLMHHPKILFLDEPTLGLDPQTRNHIWSYIKNLNKKENITVFFTTHYMEEAERYARRISIIDHGKIIKTGSPKDIIKSTKKKNLEDAFITLTGKQIREEEAGVLDHMRMRSRMWRKRR